MVIIIKNLLLRLKNQKEEDNKAEKERLALETQRKMEEDEEQRLKDEHEAYLARIAKEEKDAMEEQEARERVEEENRMAIDEKQRKEDKEFSDFESIYSNSAAEVVHNIFDQRPEKKENWGHTMKARKDVNLLITAEYPETAGYEEVEKEYIYSVENRPRKEDYILQIEPERTEENILENNGQEEGEFVFRRDGMVEDNADHEGVNISLSDDPQQL